MVRCAFNRDLFIKENGCSEYFSPHSILTKRAIDFSKHLRYSFGTYVIASYEERPKNIPKPRGIDSIYIRPAKNLQGGHEVMDLITGRVITRPKVHEMKMTCLVVKRVEEMARKQGLKSMKFFDRKRNQIIFNPIDLLKGVQEQNEQQEDKILEENDAEHGNNLPVPGDEDLFQPGELLDDQQDHILDVDSDVDENEIAEILDDAKNYEDAQVEDPTEDV